MYYVSCGFQHYCNLFKPALTYNNKRPVNINCTNLYDIFVFYVHNVLDQIRLDDLRSYIMYKWTIK